MFDYILKYNVVNILIKSGFLNLKTIDIWGRISPVVGADPHALIAGWSVGSLGSTG